MDQEQTTEKDQTQEELEKFNTCYQGKDLNLMPWATPGLQQNEVLNRYQQMQDSESSYDELADKYQYNAPRTAADRMAKMIDPKDRADYYTLDVGAGTGFVGVQLQKLGFHNIDGLEPSYALLEKAIDKEVYKKTFNCFMTAEETPDLKNDQYDGLTCCGCFIENHMPVGAVDELIRVVKPGGVIVILTRQAYLFVSDTFKELEPHMNKLEANGRWKRVSREVITDYAEGDEGVVWVYVKC